MTFFTVGPKPARAWTVVGRGAVPCPKQPHVIHTDFERGFIKAETIAYNDYITHNGEHGAREAGKSCGQGKARNIWCRTEMCFISGLMCKRSD